ncbi:MAG: galactose mutarotase [Tetrasphaera sp.]|nr:galactose mutarotase [Tetrasphaera sp.]
MSPEDRAAGAGGYRLAAGDLTVDVLEQGATIQRLFVPDAAGHVRNIVLGHSGPGDYRQSTGYLGAVVGRYANRIAGGRFELDGRQWVLAANEGTTTLHGGPDGFDRRLWTVLEVQGDRLTLQLVSPHGDGGFPGRLVVTVTYAVSPDRLRIDLSATTDAPTVVNLTNHSYFNLDGEDAPTIHEHALQVAAESYLPTGPDGIPTGEVASVEGTPFDLREARVLGEVLRAPHPQIAAAGGLDHTFVVRGSGIREHAVLTSARTGLRLAVSSDQPGIQVYTGDHLQPLPVGTSGRSYLPGAGVALETQHFPDSPHRPEFPSTVLRPGETFSTTTIWDITAAG